MKNKLNTLFVLFWVCLIPNFYAQSKLTLTAPDSLAFVASIDGRELNSVPMNYISIFEISSGKRELAVNVFGQEAKLNLNLKKLIHYQFKISCADNIFQILPIGETKCTALQFKKVKSNASPKSEAYEGKKGCETPINDSTFEAHLIALKKLPFDAQRKTELNNLCLNYCLKVDQVSRCIELLEMEEGRVEVILACLPKIYDLVNAQNLLTLFYLEGNRKIVQNRINELQENSSLEP
ncbi:MAG: DUF4476 domain-containing protein [Bacteroidota bacterium]